MIGGGTRSMIGILHRVAASMYNRFELTGGVFSSDPDENLRVARELAVDKKRVYRDLDEFIDREALLREEDRISTVAVLTPNILHFPMAQELLLHGFNVICEKPMTVTAEQAKLLRKIQQDSGLVFAVTYTYSGYPMVREMRHLVRKGAVGDVRKVDIQYYQGWLSPVLQDPEQGRKTWRLDPDKAGISCCMGDIGIHAYHMLHYVTQLRGKQVLADLDYSAGNPLDVGGTVLLRLEAKAKALIRASQVATGEENNFTVSIYGTRGGLKWEQENPNQLSLIEQDSPVRLLRPGNLYNSEEALAAVKLPAGHPEGIFDAMGNIYKGIAKAIAKKAFSAGEFPGIQDGLEGVTFLEKIIESHKTGNSWIRLRD